MSLYIATCDMDLYYAVRRFYFFHITRSYKAYFLHTNQSYIFREQFLLLALMTTYLMDLTQSKVDMVDSYGKTGLRVFGSTSSISTWSNEFG